MITLDNLIQGTPEWLAARQDKFTASEAPAMMGASKFKTRNELLQEKSTGITPEIDSHTQKIFDRGHASEAGARPIAEEIIGEDLYPITATSDDGFLLASFDGLTILNEYVWEHKLQSKALVAQIDAGELEEHYVWQLEQQILISGAEKALFMCSDGTKENCKYMWYYPQEGYAARLVAGWKQFEEDLKSFVPAEVKQEVRGAAPTELMALNIQINGAVTASNLAEFKGNAIAVFENINTVLVNDEDFANAEATVKWCKAVEDKLAATKDHALSQTASIDELFKTIDALSQESRSKRLELDKLVKARKQALKIEIAMTAKSKLDEHRDTLNSSLGGTYLPAHKANFEEAMKGKRTIESLRGACDDLVATLKILMNEQAEAIRENLKVIDESEHAFLFHDKPQLVLRDCEFVVLTVNQRVNEHKEKERVRIEAEAQRIADQKIEAARIEREKEVVPQEEKHNLTTATEFPLREPLVELPKRAELPKVEIASKAPRSIFDDWWNSTGLDIRPKMNEAEHEYHYRIARAAYELAKAEFSQNAA